MDSVADAQQLFVALTEEVAAFDVLRGILLSEQDALLLNDVESVSRLAEHKAKLVDQLSEAAAERARSLRRLGHPDTAQGVRDWIASHRGPQAGRLSPLWQRLLDAARDARRMNESNGRIVLTRMQHNHGALTALHAAARRLSLYGPDGLNSLTPDQRELGCA